MHIFLLFRNSIKVIVKKFLIVLTCIMLVFCVTVGKARAFELVTASVVGAVVVGLCALTGVIITDPNAYDNASDFLNWAVDSYSEFYNDTMENAHKFLNDVSTTVYDTGKLAIDKVNEMLPWLSTFVNDKILPVFGTRDISAISVFNNGTRIYRDLPLHSFGAGKVFDLVYRGLSFYVAGSSSSNYLYSYVSNGNTSYIKYYQKNGVNFYDFSCFVDGILQTKSFVSCYIDTRGKLVFNGNGTSNMSANLGSSTPNIYILGNSDVVIDYLGDMYYYHASTDSWSKDMNGELQLDPDLFNKNDGLGDIDIGKGFEQVYNETTNSIDMTNKFLIGHDATWDIDGSLVDSGSVSIPTDFTNESVKDWVNSSDYPFVTDKPLDQVISDDVVADYPDYVPSVPNLDYTADWTSVFPFCIPFDIFRFFELLSATPEAPHFSWNYDLICVKGTLNIDLKKFDDVARICRNMMDLLFIVGLAMVTRSHLIKA